MDVNKTSKAKMLSDVEVGIIRDFMFLHKDELERSHSVGGAGAVRRNRKLWQRLTDQVNAVGVGVRTPD